MVRGKESKIFTRLVLVSHCQKILVNAVWPTLAFIWRLYLTLIDKLSRKYILKKKKKTKIGRSASFRSVFFPRYDKIWFNYSCDKGRTNVFYYSLSGDSKTDLRILDYID